MSFVWDVGACGLYMESVMPFRAMRELWDGREGMRAACGLYGGREWPVRELWLLVKRCGDCGGCMRAVGRL